MQIFVVPGGTLILFRMPYKKKLGSLSVKWNTIEPKRDMSKINTLSTEDKPFIKQNSSDNPRVSNKNIYKIDSFIAGPEIQISKEVLKAVST